MKTLKPEPELDDEQWLGIIDEAIELGIVEAVLTGGEPLLRKRLTLEAAKRLSDAGVAVIVNTNGWFVDEATAQTLAALANVRVSVSIDGVTPEIHDTGRGVPGSWIRAVEGANRLLAAGADVRVNHVVTPTNQHEVEAFVDAMVAFGVRSLRVTGAGAGVGAASRAGDWRLESNALAHTMAKVQSRYKGELAMRYLPQNDADSFDVVPQVFLVRPSGAVVLDSRRPVRFNRGPGDLKNSWAAIRKFWAEEGSKGLEDRLAGHIAYREADVDLSQTTIDQPVVEVAPTPVSIAPKPPSRAPRQIPLGVPVLADAGDVRAGRSIIDELAAARRYRTARLRWAGDGDGQRHIRTASGKKHVIDRRAGALLDAFAQGACVSIAVAEASVACHAPASSLHQITRDLVRRELLCPDRAESAFADSSDSR